MDGFRDWGNSLRPPVVARAYVYGARADAKAGRRPPQSAASSMWTLLSWTREGGELAVLEGAKRLLQTAPRPAILAEIENIRTRPWGYPAREIMQMLARWNYR